MRYPEILKSTGSFVTQSHGFVYCSHPTSCHQLIRSHSLSHINRDASFPAPGILNSFLVCFFCPGSSAFPVWTRGRKSCPGVCNGSAVGGGRRTASTCSRDSYIASSMSTEIPASFAVSLCSEICVLDPLFAPAPDESDLLELYDTLDGCLPCSTR